MKYIITESQYSNILDKFITKRFEPHENKFSDEYPSLFWVNDKEVTFWVKDGEVVAEVIKPRNRTPIFRISNKIYKTIRDVFGIYDKNVLNNVIIEWYKNHYGVEYVMLSSGRLE